MKEEATEHMADIGILVMTSPDIYDLTVNLRYMVNVCLKVI